MALPVGLQQPPSQPGTQEASLSVAGDAQLSQSLAAEIAAISPELSSEQTEVVESIEVEIQEICRRVEHAPGCTDTGQLHRLGSLHFGALRGDDVVDFVFVAALRVPLKTLPSQVQQLLVEKYPDLQTSQALPMGPFSASGLCFCLRGVKISLLFSQSLPACPAPSAEIPVPQLSAFHALEAENNILASVASLENFSKLLRFVRHWARQRGIDGGLLGFFTGLAWAICCARICQMSPSANLTKLTLAFFRNLATWDWRMPVQLLQNGAHAQAPVQNGTSEPKWNLVQLDRKSVV